MNRKQITYLIIFIAIFLIAIVGATYAYLNFGTIEAGGNIPLGTSVGSSSSFTAYSEGNINLDINKEVMAKDASSNVAAISASANIHVTLDGGAGNSSTTCAYDLIWVWDSTDQYKESSVSLPYIHTDSTKYKFEFSVKVEAQENNLSDFTWNDNRAIIATRTIGAAAGESKKDDYEVKVNVYNMPISQNALAGKNFQAHIEVSEARCSANPSLDVVANSGDNLASSIKKLYTSQGIDVGSGKLYLHDSTLENGASDGSYRYSGIDPDNYLCFEGDTCDDDHKYRIIGIFQDNIKVVKLTSIGDYMWNSEKENTWAGSTMDNYLNNDWLTSFGHSDIIEDYEWSVGGITGGDIIEDKTVKDTYDVELNKSAVVKRKVGLMYASDYGFAAESKHWTRRLYGYEQSKGYNWMLTSSYRDWTISRSAAYTGYAFYVGSAGFVSDGKEGVDYAQATRPAFYLKASAVYKGGNGTKNNPIIVDNSASGKIKSLYTSQGSAAGENGVMYLHDSSLENGANDGSYRFAGADPDNYVCFEGDTCDDEHKYRIIGIFGDNLKVIKMTSVGKKQWNVKDINTWESSIMATYLNGDWLTNFGHSDLIEDYEWSVGGHNGYGTSKAVFDAEMSSSLKITQKVGLMYVSDYGFAAENNNYWATDVNNYKPEANDWLYLKSIEWLITRFSDNNAWAFTISGSGAGVCNYDNVFNNRDTRPSFYLKSTAIIKSGNGTSANPYIIGM